MVPRYGAWHLRSEFRIQPLSALSHKRLRLQSGRKLSQLRTCVSIEIIRRDGDHTSDRLCEPVGRSTRAVDHGDERRPNRRGKRQIRQPLPRTSRSLAARFGRESALRPRVVGETRREIRRQRDFSMTAERTASGERGERGEPKTRRLQSVRGRGEPLHWANNVRGLAARRTP
jgi:hypothetical protein